VDQQQVKEPVQDGVLADIATRNLIGEQVEDWAGQDLGRAVGGVAPATHPE
jgi:hypothetical protein